MEFLNKTAKSTDACKMCTEYSIHSRCGYKKTCKLQKIFETETLETLNTIEFKYTQQKKKSSKKNNKASQNKENKKTNEEVSSEMTDNTLEEHIAETKKESSDVRTITPPENITSHYDLSKVLG